MAHSKVQSMFCVDKGSHVFLFIFFPTFKNHQVTQQPPPGTGALHVGKGILTPSLCHPLAPTDTCCAVFSVVLGVSSLIHPLSTLAPLATCHRCSPNRFRSPHTFRCGCAVDAGSWICRFRILQWCLWNVRVVVLVQLLLMFWLSSARKLLETRSGKWGLFCCLFTGGYSVLLKSTKLISCIEN